MPASRYIRLRLSQFAAVLLFIVAALPFGNARAEHVVDPAWFPPATVYIAETGHTLDRLFLDLWRNGGGFNSYGYPITPEITQPDGHIVQYLQYARFEYWPEGNDDGLQAFVADIGHELQPEPVTEPKGRSWSYGDAQIRQVDALRMAEAWKPLPAKTGQRANTADWRFVPETRHSVQFGFKTFWEATGEVWYLGYPISEEYVIDEVTYQAFERGQLAWQLAGDVWMVPVGEVLAEKYKLETTAQLQNNIPLYDESMFVPRMLDHPEINAPRPPAGYDRAIVVSLNDQMLWAWEGGKVVLETYVSTGRDRFATPPGLFFINWKLPVQDMEGVIGGEYYNVPQVPDVMYFTGRGHAIHGTYWHNNFGAPMSHGCVNVPMGTSTWLYQWAPEGTPVLIVN